ncbi:hypothetical protein METBIDRAFT_22306, partial [Metschnikowia bicuspidata var. bicuspidata NRRL YB-4993]
FWNNGDMFFGLCKTQFQETPFLVVSQGLWLNQGTLIFQKEKGSMAGMIIDGKSPNDNSRAVTNQGSICLYNTNWRSHTNIKGNGCITVGPTSKL